MQQAQAPDKFPIPFANNAGSSYTRPIPEGSQIGIVDGAASLTDGFPPANFQPVDSGGVPPFGQDMNGLLHQITQWCRWQAAGALNLYDAAFSAKIGGYPRGAILSSTTPGVAWLSTVDNNVTNPDTGGAQGWQMLVTGATVPQTSLIHAGADISTSANVITIPTLIPSVSGLANYQIFEIIPANSITGAAQITIQNFASVPLKRADGGDFQNGDGPAGQPFLAMFLNGTLRRLAYSYSEIASFLTIGGGQSVINTFIQNNPSVSPPRNLVSFTTAGAGSWTVPDKVTWIYVELVGAGGGGHGGSGGVTWAAGGGGSGGYSARWISVTPGQTISYVVGAGGPGSDNTPDTFAGGGGTTAFGSYLQASGGGGGRGGTNDCRGGTPGVGSGGQKNFYGGNGGDGNPGRNDVQGGNGASSAFGGGGRTATANAPIMNGVAPGSGGGGIWSSGAPAQTGGNGADGGIIIQY